jgi:hypothetical protein
MTVVQFLKDRLPSLFEHDDNGFYRKLFEEADEMHKEETMDAFQAGKWDGYENKVCGAKQFKDPAEYYNETFKK